MVGDGVHVRRSSLVDRLAFSSKLVRNVRQVCELRYGKHFVVCDILKWFGKCDPGGMEPRRVLEGIRLARNKDIHSSFVSPQDEEVMLIKRRAVNLFALNRYCKALNEFRAIACHLRNLQEETSMMERLNLFLCEEQARARAFSALDAYDLDFLRKLDLVNKTRADFPFIKSLLMTDHASFIAADYILRTTEEELDKCNARLSTVHEEIHNTLSIIHIPAANAIQHAWRYFTAMKKLAATAKHFEERLSKVTASRNRYADRLHMQQEEEFAIWYRKCINAILLIQGQVRVMFARSKLGGIKLYNHREWLRKTVDAAMQAKIRKEIESMKQLRLWRCPHCEKLGMKRRRVPFESWQQVEQHTADHNYLNVKRREVKQEKKRQLQRRTELSRSKELRTFKELKHKRLEREKWRFKVCLIRVPFYESNLRDETNRFELSLSHIQEVEKWKGGKNKGAVLSYILEDGETRIGRNRRVCEWAIDSKLWPRLMSKHHCTITVSRDVEQNLLTISILDCGSTNGTSLNGTTLPKDQLQVIHFGDKIVFGNCPDNPLKREKSDLVFRVCKVDTLS